MEELLDMLIIKSNEEKFDSYYKTGGIKNKIIFTLGLLLV